MLTKDLKNILIADDSTFFRIKISDMLLEAGYKARFAKNGREAVDEIRRDSKIDLLLLDLEMPNIDGFGVLKWIEENGYKGKFPILIISSIYEPLHAMKNLKNLVATGFMQKDLPPEHILFNISKILASNEKTAEWSGKGRVPVYLPVTFSIKNTKYSGSLINISESGAFLYANTELSKGTKITLEFYMGGQDRILKIESSVQWCTHTLQNRTLLYWYGIMFTSIAQEDREILRNFVAETKRLLSDTNAPER